MSVEKEQISEKSGEIYSAIENDTSSDDIETSDIDTSDLSTDLSSVESEHEKYIPSEQIEESFVDNFYYKIILTSLYLLLYLGKGFSQMSIVLTLTDLHTYLEQYQDIDIGTVRFYAMVLRGLGLLSSAYLIGKLCEKARPTKWYHMNLHHVLCVISFFGNCVTLFLIPLIPNAYVVFILNFFWGVGANAIMVVCQILCRLVWKEKRMNAAIYQGFLFSFAFGMFLYSYLVGSLVDFDNWSSQKTIFIVYYVGGCVQGLPYIFLFFFPAPKNDIGSSTTTSDDDTKKEKKKDKKSSSFFGKIYDSWKKIEGLRFFFISMIAFTYVLHMSHIKIFQNLIPSFCTDIGWTKTNGAYATSVFFFAYAISRFFAIFINYYVESTILVAVYLFGTLVTLFVMMIYGSSSNFVLWIGFGSVGFFLSPMFAAISQIPRCFLVELTHVERALMMSPLGLGSAMPGPVGSLMSSDSDWYLYSANLMGIVILVTFIVSIVIGVFLKKKYTLQQQEEKNADIVETEKETELEDILNDI